MSYHQYSVTLLSIVQSYIVVSLLPCRASISILRALFVPFRYVTEMAMTDQMSWVPHWVLAQITEGFIGSYIATTIANYRAYAKRKRERRGSKMRESAG
ncbi:unnamed protein product [Amoebophrya sp. A25]|nr:unnamed protein product [Amoebophrya sp. A25]|eukprot:GSA25T00018138001.1